MEYTKKKGCKLPNLTDRVSVESYNENFKSMDTDMAQMLADVATSKKESHAALEQIEAAGGKIATAETLGVSKPDGTTITIGADGTMTATAEIAVNDSVSTSPEKSTIQSVINVIGSTINSVKTSISDISTKVNNLTTNLATLANDHDALKTDFNTTRSDIYNKIKKSAMFDTRSTNQTPTWYRETYGMGVIYEFKSDSSINTGMSGYIILITMIPWSDESGGDVIQLAIRNTTIKKRCGTTTSWSSWC